MNPSMHESSNSSADAATGAPAHLATEPAGAAATTSAPLARSRAFAPGLEGVVVAETLLSRVDGTRGHLLLRGYPLRELAGVYPFEAIAQLMWTGDLTREHGTIGDLLARGRALGYRALGRIGDALDAPDAMDALRAGVAHLRLPTGDSADAVEGDVSADIAAAAQLAGAIATLVAAWWRRRQGGAPVAPESGVGHAHDFLRMLSDKRADARAVAALDAYLATVVDHGMNASTFAARVVTSTGADMVSAVVAAIGALSGPLHGGAPGPVLDMLDAIGQPERAAAWVDAEMAAGRRIMGMGHRVYRVRDPRAAVLEQAARALAEDPAVSARFALARAVEQAAEARLRIRHPDRPIHANVEFYTALLLSSVGLDRTLFSAVFAAARVVGWTAHILEERTRGRLIRPKARYVGPVFADA